MNKLEIWANNHPALTVGLGIMLGVLIKIIADQL